MTTPAGDGETPQDLLAGPLGPPSPISIERAWHNLMSTLAHTNAGYAVGANRQRKALHGLMRRNGWKGAL